MNLGYTRLLYLLPFAVADYVAGKTTRQQAASRIAGRFREWVAMFENARTRQAQAL